MNRSLFALVALGLLGLPFVSAETAAPIGLPEPVVMVAELPEPVARIESGFTVSIAGLWAESPEPYALRAPAPAVPIVSVSPRFDLPVAELWAALDAPVQFVSLGSFAQAAGVSADAKGTSPDDAADLQGLLNNEHYRESLRLKRMAEDAFEYGDYDAAAVYANEAAEAAARSDAYVALRLRIREVDQAIAKAKDRLDWAVSVNAEKNYAERYRAAADAYAGAVESRAGEAWDLALRFARQVLEELASVEAMTPLPARYTVRPWAQTKDCFWTIAGYAWVYGDPTKWPLLYEANKAKLPRPDNPNLVWAGTVLSIPSLKGELREGAWDKAKSYSPLSSGRK